MLSLSDWRVAYIFYQNNLKGVEGCCFGRVEKLGSSLRIGEPTLSD